MTHEERPITFTISKTEAGFRMHTKDGRVHKYNQDVGFNRDQLFTMMDFATNIYNEQGFAVLFEID